MDAELVAMISRQAVASLSAPRRAESLIGLDEVVGTTKEPVVRGWQKVLTVLNRRVRGLLGHEFSSCLKECRALPCIPGAKTNRRPTKADGNQLGTDLESSVSHRDDPMNPTRRS